jgi:hypothetical protein
MNTSKYKHKNVQPKNKNISNKAYQELLGFKYLCSLVTYDNNCGKDVRTGITAGKRSYQTLSESTRSRYIPQHTKLKIYTTMIKPTLLYGCEMWARTEQMKLTTNMWQRKIQRKIYGPIKDQNLWRI